jgi:hypothetical protein
LLRALEVIGEPKSPLPEDDLKKRINFLSKVIDPQSPQFEDLKKIIPGHSELETLSIATQRWVTLLKMEAREAKKALLAFNNTADEVLKSIIEIKKNPALYADHADSIRAMRKRLDNLERKDPISLRHLATPKQLDTQFDTYINKLEQMTDSFLQLDVDDSSAEENKKIAEKINNLLRAAVVEKELKINFTQVETVLGDLKKLKESDNGEVKKYVKMAELVLANADLQTPLIATFAIESKIKEAPDGGYFNALQKEFNKYRGASVAKEKSYNTLFSKAPPTDLFGKNQFRENTIQCNNGEKVVWLEAQVDNGENYRSDLVSLPKHLIPEKFIIEVLEKNNISNHQEVTAVILEKIRRKPNILQEKDGLIDLLKKHEIKNTGKLASKIKNRYNESMSQEYNKQTFPSNELIRYAMHQVLSHIAVSGTQPIHITNSFDKQYVEALYLCAKSINQEIYDFTGLLSRSLPKQPRGGILKSSRDTYVLKDIDSKVGAFRSLLAEDPLTKKLYDDAVGRREATKESSITRTSTNSPTMPHR